METTRTTMSDYDKEMMEQGDELPVEAFYNEGPNRPLYYFFYKQNSSSGGTSGGTGTGSGGTGSQQPSSFDTEVKGWIRNINDNINGMKDDISDIKETESSIDGTVSDIKQKLDDGICNCSGGSSLTIENLTDEPETESEKVTESPTLEEV